MSDAVVEVDKLKEGFGRVDDTDALPCWLDRDRDCSPPTFPEESPPLPSIR